jgi:Xaa-Pro aminopeptidase
MPAAASAVAGAGARPPSSPGTAPTSARLAALRAELARRGVDALVVPSGDPHASEYSAACFGRREFVSGFTGSAGVAVVTADTALLWTDGRYFLQAMQELDANWTLMKAGLPSTPTVHGHLATALPAGAKVGVDALMHSVESASKLRDVLQAADKALVPLDGDNPVDVVWGADRPTLPTAPIRVHPLQYAGVSAGDKIEALRRQMVTKKCDALLVSSLDEVCWLLNIRGDDVPHCPVVISYALVTVSDGAFLYVDRSKVLSAGPGVAAALADAGVSVRDYADVVGDVKRLCGSGARIWLDPASTSLAISKAAEGGGVLETSPIVLAKARKNDAELDAMRSAHLKDGAALSSFLCWLEARVNGPDGDISEVDAAIQLERFRAQQDGFLSTSFDTIAGSGANGAIIHYSAKRETCAPVSNRDVFLLDSGGQYADGTTDVTRTMHLGGKATGHQRECYTRVLQGHMAIDSAVFPTGTTGFMLDALARGPLWSMGLEYRHGTGHGVGAALNVHEGPHSISPRMGSNKTPLQANFVVSNEPGYYADGEFGIRIENLVCCVEKQTKHKFDGMTYLGFDRLTFVPIDVGMILPELLSGREVAWLDGYHSDVWEKISPRLPEGSAERQWLWDKTRPLVVPGKSGPAVPAGVGVSGPSKLGL